MLIKFCIQTHVNILQALEYVTTFFDGQALARVLISKSKKDDKDQETKSISKSKKDDKDQETIQSSTTPDPGYHMGK